MLKLCDIVGRCRSWSIGGVVVLSCLALLPRLSPAQTLPAIPSALERIGPVNAEKRADLERQLRDSAQVLQAQSNVLKITAKLVGPAVVYIEAETTTQPKGKSNTQVEEAGSGVIIDFKGKPYVLTNRHVVSGATREGIKINLADGRRINPTRVWTDSETDVGVLEVSAPDLVTAKIGNSDKVETGDFVLAVGSPFGLSNSVTFGIISAKGRRDLRFGDANVRFQDFLQTDASINPGNSGGPLVNLYGEVIGINTAIASNTGRNEGIGFAIPITMFMQVGSQLIESGKVVRAYLGVSLNSKFGPSMASEAGLPCLMGAQVTAISKGSPAEAAKLAIGDVVIEFNSVRIEDDAHLVNLVSLTKVGTRVPLVVFRNRQTFTVDVEVGDRGKLQPGK